MIKSYIKILVIIFIVFYGCSKQTNNLLDFYYPIENLKNKKIYCYKCQMNGTVFMGFEAVWSDTRENKTMLFIEPYTAQMHLTNRFEFEIKKREVNLHYHILFKKPPNITQDYKSEIVSNIVLLSKKKDCNLEYNNEYERVKRTRQFQEKKEDIIFEGKNYPAVEFLDKLTITKHQKGETCEIKRTSIYCKNIGLYQTINKYSDGRVIIKTLDKIIGFEDWFGEKQMSSQEI